jgi:hypothetical protein
VTRSARHVVLVASLLVSVVVGSGVEGIPGRLPGAALGWPLLFHLERASALLGTTGVVLLVGWRALRGEFPIRFGNVEYAVKEAAAGADEVSASHDRRLQLVEAALRIGANPSDAQ